MAERRLLVLGAGPAQLGLLAAARRRGLVTVAADRDPAAPGFRYAERRALVSVEDEPALERLARAERVAGVVTAGSDRTPAVAARIAEKLALPQSLRPEVAQVLAARQRERDALAAAGIPLVDGVVCETPADARRVAERLGFPCTVGALDRPAGAAVLVGAADEVEQAVERATAESRVTPCIVEAQPATRVVVAGIATGAGFRPLLVADDDQAGPVWPAATPRAGDAVALALRAVAALGVGVGVCEVRVALGEDGPRVVAVAPRLGHGHEPELCRAAVGVDLYELALAAALGEPLNAAALAPAPCVGAACIRFLPPSSAAVPRARLAEAFAVAGVAGIRLYRGRDRGGAVLATGADREEALAAAARASALVRFERADAEAVA